MADPEVQLALLELEEQRKLVAKASQNSYLIIGAGIAAGVIGFLVPAIQLPGIIAGAIILLVGIWFYVRSRKFLGEYTWNFKQKVLRAVLLTVDPSLHIEPQKGLTEAEFNFSQLFTKSPDRMHSEDQVSGHAGKTPFVFSEVHAEYKIVTHTKHGRRETWHDIFEGIIFVADFNKKFRGTTIVRPRDAGSALTAWVAKNLPVLTSADDLLVELENTVFCKEFVTWSTDQVEARYLLTPAMMERLCELNSRSKQTISVSFNGNNLYVAVPLNKNYFEPPVFKTLLDDDLLKEDIAIVKFMIAIVEDLDLNVRIWGE